MCGEKRKIYLITNGFPWGKGEKTFIIPEINYLKEKYDLTVIANASDKILLQQEYFTKLDDNIKVIRYPANPLPLTKKVKGIINSLFHKEIWIEVAKILKTKENIFTRLRESIGFYVVATEFSKWLESSNIIKRDEKAICYSYWSNYYLLSAVIKRRDFPNLKIVARLHGVDLYNERYCGGRQPFKWMMDQVADCFLFVSEQAMDYYLDNYAVNRKVKRKYQLCKLGIQGVNCNSRHKSPDSFCILSCSFMVPLKRIALIIDALAGIKDIHIRWTHFGDGEEMQMLVNKAQKELGDNITYCFKGYANNETIIKYYQEEFVDCFITTSSTEGGSPVSIMEAMSAYVPIIGTNVGGISGMIKDNGILLSQNPSVTEIQDAIKKIYYSNCSEVEAMRENSYSLWKKEFSAKINVEKVMKIFDGLLAENEV